MFQILQKWSNLVEFVKSFPPTHTHTHIVIIWCCTSFMLSDFLTVNSYTYGITTKSFEETILYSLHDLDLLQEKSSGTCIWMGRCIVHSIVLFWLIFGVLDKNKNTQAIKLLEYKNHRCFRCWWIVFINTLRNMQINLQKITSRDLNYIRFQPVNFYLKL